MRSFFFFFFWFLWIGGANVVPQLYFLEQAPLHKETLTSILLVLGSAVSMIGIWLGTKAVDDKRAGWRLGQIEIYAVVVIAVGCFSFLLSHPSIAIYFLCYIAFRLLSCAACQSMDLAVVNGSAVLAANSHNRLAVLWMFGAITISPLFFAYVRDLYWLVPILSGLGLIALVLFDSSVLSSDKKTHAASEPHNSIDKRGGDTTSLSGCDHQFLMYCAAYMSIVYMTSALLVFFMRDYYAFSSPAEPAGWVMVFSSGSATVSCLCIARFGKHWLADISTISIRVAMVLPLFSGIGLLYLKLDNSLPYLCFCTSLMGAAYGLFMLSTRQYAAASEKRPGKGLLASYNMLPNLSTLFIFLLVALLQPLSNQINVGFYTLVGWLIVALALLAVFNLLSLKNQYRAS